MSGYPASGAAHVSSSARLSELDMRTFHAVRELVESDEEVWIVVTGVSMRPTLEPGDRVLLKKAEHGSVAGRIVLADLCGRPVLHRVVTERHGQLVTAGDHCSRPDPPITRAAVLARAEAVHSVRGVAALRLTLRFGVLALARYGWLEARALVLRLWRRVRYRLPLPIWIWSADDGSER